MQYPVRHNAAGKEARRSSSRRGPRPLRATGVRGWALPRRASRIDQIDSSMPLRSTCRTPKSTIPWPINITPWGRSRRMVVFTLMNSFKPATIRGRSWQMSWSYKNTKYRSWSLRLLCGIQIQIVQLWMLRQMWTRTRTMICLRADQPSLWKIFEHINHPNPRE